MQHIPLNHTELQHAVYHSLDLIARITCGDEKFFDTLVIVGVSGSLVGGPVALKLHKNLLIIRKEDEKSHDGPYSVDYAHPPRKILFLDVGIDLGVTLRRVLEVLPHFSTFEALVGIVFYNQEAMVFTERARKSDFALTQRILEKASQLEPKFNKVIPILGLE